MNIKGIIWLEEVEEKIYTKHHVTSNEVEDVLQTAKHFRFAEKGMRQNEDMYAVLGRTRAGRHLTVYFIYKTTKEALIITAREMTRKERKTYVRA